MVGGMFWLVLAMLGAARSAFRSRSSLIAENLALRQQLAVLHARRRPRLRPVDRAFWVVLSRVWSRWADVLAIVRPATVIEWHRLRRGLLLRVPASLELAGELGNEIHSARFRGQLERTSQDLFECGPA